MSRTARAPHLTWTLSTLAPLLLLVGSCGDGPTGPVASTTVTVAISAETPSIEPGAEWTTISCVVNIRATVLGKKSVAG